MRKLVAKMPGIFTPRVVDEMQRELDQTARDGETDEDRLERARRIIFKYEQSDQSDQDETGELGPR